MQASIAPDGAVNTFPCHAFLLALIYFILHSLGARKCLA
jgi:hypothetical protein